jgi:inner membrane protein
MSDSAAPSRPDGGGFDLSRLLPRRSFGLKLILVCFLALLMAIPAGFVWALIYSRSIDANNAMQEVAQLRGGPQDLMGPAIVVPFERDVITSVNSVTNTTQAVQTIHGRMVLYPETGRADAILATEVRKRGLHDVPVYSATVNFTAAFDLARISAEAPAGSRLKWNEARIYMSMSDLRGAKEATLTVGGQKLELAPVEQQVSATNPTPLSYHPLMGAVLNWTDPPPAGPLQTEATLAVTGAQRITIASFARDTTINMEGDWGSPKFDGGALPDTRTVDNERFTASWRTPFLARGAPGVGADLSFDSVINSAPGATLLDPGNPYQSVERALKYAPMFFGLVFLTYFLFEVTSQMRAHPAQYVLVGLAQTVFYMLLLSISEVAGFNLGFLIAATATVLTLSLYAGSVFASRWAMAKAFVVFATIYALIYVLMKQEDYGLLVGSVASFAAIAGTMWMTRNLDWYGVGRTPPAPQTQPAA